ncbi:MAG TPA: hypothetical protein VNZ05_02660 [Solirubrobacteraceae bacterium]|nr:hypothetical protein [Solirubrobacteraceae bacterium]
MNTPTIENGTTPANASGAAHGRIGDLVVRIAAAGDRDAIAELASRSGAPAPSGALMVCELDGRVLAAVSVSGDEAIAEPTSRGAAAAAVTRYRVAQLSPRRRVGRLSAIAA